LQPRLERRKESRTGGEGISDIDRTPSSRKREKGLSVSLVANRGKLQQIVGRTKEKENIMPLQQRRKQHHKRRLQQMSLGKITSLSLLSRDLSLTIMCG